MATQSDRPFVCANRSSASHPAIDLRLMCGICGYTGSEVDGLLGRMTEVIRHRGPDADGQWHGAGMHLGSRRLRVVDLAGGDQPIFDEDRSLVVVFNGEIYNHAPLRHELEAAGHRFATRSDTEVIVHLYEQYGLDCASHLNGMFAFALWDTRRRRLLLARDPVGIKPLLYAWNGRELIFGSEAKSVLLHPSLRPELDRKALHDLLNVRFVPGPRTLFRGIRQLPAGHLLVVEQGRPPQERRYHEWRLRADREISPGEAAEGFLEILSRAMERQMVADVPLGLYLSGGLDSSALLAAASAKRQASGISTFTLGLGEPTDETADAAIVARHFGSDHRQTTISARPLELLPRIIYHAEMPKVNAPQGYYLSRFAREHVTVALSGLGGDELFFGYELYRYLWPGRLLVDSPLAGILGRLSPPVDALAQAFDRAAGLRAENSRRALELAASGGDALRYYATLRNGWDLGRATAEKLYAEDWRRGLEHTTRESLAPLFDRPDLALAEQVQWAELRGKMVDDFLLNEDRMSMACSLEVRVPLLDLEMVDFALSLPFRVKHEGRRLKPVMKKALRPLLPASILGKRKWGFTFDPYEQFRKDLRPLAEQELSEAFLREQGIFDPLFVRKILDHPPTRKLHWHYFMLWQILGFKIWQEIFLEGRDWREIEARLAGSRSEGD